MLCNGAFTLPDTDTDKMGSKPNGHLRWCLSLYTIPYKPFLSLSVSGCVNIPQLVPAHGMEQEMFRLETKPVMDKRSIIKHIEQYFGGQCILYLRGAHISAELELYTLF